MKAINIQWDVDYPEDLESLPKEIEIPSDVFCYEDGDDIDEYLDEISDYISDITGFCHFGFNLIGHDFASDT